MSNIRPFVTAGLGLLAIGCHGPARADDWPNFRGPARNGISAEKGLNLSAPKKLWGAQVGQGFSSVSIVGGKAFTMGNDGRNDTVWCFNAANGQVTWRYSYPCQSGGGGYGGPRSTPAFEAGRIYTQSNDGRVFCLDANSGKLIWQRNVAGEVRASQPQWGFSGSPLVHGSLVIVNIGRAGTALDKASGNIKWTTGAGSSGYSTPVPYKAGATDAVAIFAGEGAMGLNAQTGKELWKFDWNTNYDVNAADPVVIGNTCFISSNYGRGSALLSFGSGGAKALWQSRNMKNHFNSSIIHNWGIFGNDEGSLRCLDSRTGQEKWSARGMGKGGLIMADGKLIALTERGELLVANADPSRYTELARTRVLGGTCWTQPSLANGLLIVRSHEGELVCLDVKGR